MSPDRYDRGSSRSRRSAWGHWVPLAITLTVATVGVAAWAWSQRKDGEEEQQNEEPDLDYENADYGDNPPYGATTRDAPGLDKPRRPDQETHGITPAEAELAGPSWGARMSGALRRTPSPQHFFDSTGKTVAAGVAAAGAAMGKALASIREEDKDAYNPWSEEADAKKDRAPGSVVSGKKRKTVAIVVSADNQLPDVQDDGFTEHAVSMRAHCVSSVADDVYIVNSVPHPPPQ